MRVKGTLTQQHAIFKITLPLVEHEKFNVFHLIPVPNLMNNTMAAIKPCTTFLGINASRKQYIPFTSSKFSSCDIIEQGVFVCSNIQIRYNFGANICTCEINLYSNKTTPTCILEKTDAKWIPLDKENQWIYASPQSSKATAVCNREIIPISLKGSGLLTLDPECILKHDSITMNGRQAISSTIRSSYTSLGKISELSLPNNITVSIHNNNSTSINLEKIYAKNMNELSNLQKTLKEENIIELPNKFKSHQLHNHAIGYLALFLSLVTLIIIAKTRRSQSRQQRPTVAIENAEETIELQSVRPETNNRTPTPMPRQFMLDI